MNKKNNFAIKAAICPQCNTVIDLRKRDWTIRTLQCPTCHKVLEIQTPLGWISTTNLDNLNEVM